MARTARAAPLRPVREDCVDVCRVDRPIEPGIEQSYFSRAGDARFQRRPDVEPTPAQEAELFQSWLASVKARVAAAEAAQREAAEANVMVGPELPEHARLYPGHDYGKTPTSTLAWEFAHNPALRADTVASFCAYKRIPAPR